MSELETSENFIEVEPMSVDQLGGFVVMVAGAIGSLLLVVWQSRCHCKFNLCYIFSCERRPPNEEELKTLADEAKELKKQGNKLNNKEDKILKKEDEILDEVESQKSLSRNSSMNSFESTHLEPEPEPLRP